MNQKFLYWGFLIIIIGFLVVIMASFMNSGTGQKNTKFAIGGFVGFIPFGFGNDKQLLAGMMILMGIVLILFFVVNFIFRHSLR